MKSFLRSVASTASTAAAVLSALVIVSGSRPARAQIPGQIELVFEPYQSILACVSRAEGVRFVDIAYRPPEPDCPA